jgi:hypothetical protein
MLRRRKVLWATLGGLMTIALVLAAVFAFSPHGAAASPTIKNFQVNQVLAGPFSKNKQNEPSLAQNPTNPLNLIAGSNDEIGEPACTNTTPSSCPFAVGVSVSGFYASFNGGTTWPCQGLINLSAFGEYGFGDPAQAFDSRGNAYYGGLAFPNPPTTAELATGQQADFFIAKSTDGGCTYPQVAKVSGNAPAIFDDKDAITADATPTSPFHDNVYAAWTKFTTGGDQIQFARSTDGGKTFSTPLPISPDYNNNHVGGRQGAAVKVGPDGTVYVVWLDTVNKQAVERLSISHDGGKTFPAQNITVATVTDDFVSPAPGSSFRQDARTFPSFAIASDSTLYVAWGNRTGDGPGLTGHAVVLVTKSTTGGLTWSTPVVAGNVSGRSAYFAAVTTDPSGKVSVVFNALDDVPGGTAPGAGVVHFDAYLTQSTNGGASFSGPLLVSTATSDPDGSSTNSLGAQFLGDYITAVADSSHVYAVWTDARAATPCAAVDAFRAGTATKPDVITSCANTFGNTDIFLGVVS